MVLPPISTNSQNFQASQSIERTREERDLEQQTPASVNEAANAEDNRTTAQPVQEASQSDRTENDTRQNQQQLQQQEQDSRDNSADSNLGSQIDISV